MPRPHVLPLLVVVLANAFLPAMGRAQPVDQPVPGHVMKRWGTAEGLPHNSGTALAQTRDGYLWIGTLNAGLARFDGVTFKTFNILNTPGLPSDQILALQEDSDGTLWIGTAAGLARYRDGAFTVEPLPVEISPTIIWDIRTDSHGTLWVVTPHQVLRHDGATWGVIPTVGDPKRLAPSADGTMWIPTSVGLVEWRDRIIRTLTTRDGLPADDIVSVHEGRRGRVWVGTMRGLAYLDRASGRIVIDTTTVPALPVERIFEDSRGVMWLAVKGRLFTFAADGAASVATLSSGGNAEPLLVNVFIEDREGQVWFGAQGVRGGIYRLARAPVSTLGHEDGLPCDNIGAITEAPDRTMWIAAYCSTGKGLMALRDGRLTAYPGPDYIMALLADPDGTLWVAGYGSKLYRLDTTTGRLEAVLWPAPGQRFYDDFAVIYRQDDRTLWLGSNHGLHRFRDGQWTRLQTVDGLVNDDVRSIVGDREGALWIGTGAGISRYHDDRFTSYRVADGVPIGPVRAIHIDVDGVVWLGSYGGGLARFKDGVFTSYGVLGGVLDTSVHRIIEDEQQFFWLPGDRGIRRVSKRDLNAIADGQVTAVDVSVFGEADGMRSAECNGMAQPAGWRTTDGALYFPTQHGVARVDPARLASHAPPPTPHVEAVVVDSVTMPVGGDIVVPPGTRDLEIRYTAPAFAKPELVQFRYELEGHSAERIEVGNRRMVSFANLKPGRYRFLVAARHSEGAWSEQPAAVTLLLQPLFYQRVSFQVALGVLAVAVVAAGGRWYVHGLRRRAAELEGAVAERTTDLSVAHQSLSAANQGLVKANYEVEQAHGQVLAVLNQLDIGVLVLSASGIVRYASTSAQRILQKDGQTLVGQPWSACLPVVVDDRSQLNARVDALSASEGRVPVQLVIGGKRYWAEIDVRAEPPPGDGRILYIYDVTEMSALPADGLSDGSHGLVGRSTDMHLVFKQIRDVARVDSTVLIQGETGVGKELVARAIHRGSLRASRPFIAVNAAGLSESLVASQLFGHRRGAFTGAVDDQQGVFEAAHGGTLFLDEIGDMPPNVQVGLLRVLQEREITRLGDSQPRRVDVRFLAATHRDLAQEVEAGRFREDLLYRIRVATILVPPLRARLDDVPLLVDAFLKQAARQSGRPTPHISRHAVDALLSHKWPGNVRELKAAIERALVNAQGDIVRLEDLPDEIISRRAAARSDEAPPEGDDERDRLVQALRRAGGNRTEAARLLGISRRTFYRRLAAQGLDTEREA